MSRNGGYDRPKGQQQSAGNNGRGSKAARGNKPAMGGRAGDTGNDRRGGRKTELVGDYVKADLNRAFTVLSSAAADAPAQAQALQTFRLELLRCFQKAGGEIGPNAMRYDIMRVPTSALTPNMDLFAKVKNPAGDIWYVRARKIGTNAPAPPMDMSGLDFDELLAAEACTENVAANNSVIPCASGEFKTLRAALMGDVRAAARLAPSYPAAKFSFNPTRMNSTVFGAFCYTAATGQSAASRAIGGN